MKPLIIYGIFFNYEGLGSLGTTFFLTRSCREAFCKLESAETFLAQGFLRLGGAGPCGLTLWVGCESVCILVRNYDIKEAGCIRTHATWATHWMTWAGQGLLNPAVSIATTYHLSCRFRHTAWPTKSNTQDFVETSAVDRKPTYGSLKEHRSANDRASFIVFGSCCSWWNNSWGMLLLDPKP